MWTALQGLIDEGRELGLNEGRKMGLNESRDEVITGLIHILRNLHIPDDLIIENIQQEFGLPADTIKKLMN